MCENEQEIKQPNIDDTIDSKIEMKQYAFELVNQWINNVDSKISIAFSIISVIFAGFGAFLAVKLNDYNWNNITGLMKFLIVAYSLLVLSFILSLAFYGVALFPKFTGKHKNESEYNLLFYGDVSRYQKNDILKYKEHFKDYDKKNFLSDIEDEIFYNSRICHKKMLFFRLGLILTGIFTLLFAACFLMLMFI